MSKPLSSLSSDEIWRIAFTDPRLHKNRVRHMYRLLPASPRCKLCNAPFSGPGGLAMRLIGKRPSKMNPRFCSVCEEFAQAHPGGAEVPLSLLFADIRGSTTLAESLGTQEFSKLIARFYDAATEVLIKADSLIDRLIGDEVIALFLPAMVGNRHAEAAVAAAKEILRLTGHGEGQEPWVPLGAGVHTGSAFVGAVGSAGVSDITALGDDVNLTARLASVAATGEILISEAARSAAGLETGGLEPRRLELKGRKEPVDVWVMSSMTIV